MCKAHKSEVGMKKILFSIALILFSITNANAACDVQKASADFVEFTQKLIETNPEKFNAAQADFQKLSQEISQLASAGKTEEICKTYDAFKAKF